MMAGLFPTPTKETIEKDLEASHNHLQATKPSVSGFVRYVKYMDDLAKDLGCFPESIVQNRGWTLSSLKALWNLYFGPVVPSQYRLVGPDSLSKL